MYHIELHCHTTQLVPDPWRTRFAVAPAKSIAASILLAEVLIRETY